MSSIAEQLVAYGTALGEAQAQGELAVAKKLEQQIADLVAFQERHPAEEEAPSPFEVYLNFFFFPILNWKEIHFSSVSPFLFTT